MKNTCMVLLVTVGVFSTVGCNIGSQEETKEECISRYLGMAFIASSAASSPDATSNARQQMTELANLAVTLSLTCEDPESDAISELFE